MPIDIKNYETQQESNELKNSSNITLNETSKLLNDLNSKESESNRYWWNEIWLKSWNGIKLITDLHPDLSTIQWKTEEETKKIRKIAEKNGIVRAEINDDEYKFKIAYFYDNNRWNNTWNILYNPETKQPFVCGDLDGIIKFMKKENKTICEIDRKQIDIACNRRDELETLISDFGIYDERFDILGMIGKISDKSDNAKYEEFKLIMRHFGDRDSLEWRKKRQTLKSMLKLPDQFRRWITHLNNDQLKRFLKWMNLDIFDWKTGSKSVFHVKWDAFEVDWTGLKDKKFRSVKDFLDWLNAKLDINQYWR